MEEDQTDCTHIAIPIPPPIHKATHPLLAPLFFIAYNRVVSTRHPEAPIGCPRAMDPPLTFTFSAGAPRSLSDSWMLFKSKRLAKISALSMMSRVDSSSTVSLLPRPSTNCAVFVRSRLAPRTSHTCIHQMVGPSVTLIQQ